MAMRVSNRRRCGGLALLVLAAALPRAGDRLLAAEPHAAASGDAQCRTVVHDYLAHAPAERQADDRIAELLDAKRYREAAAALRNAVSHRADAWAGHALGNLYAAGLGVPRDAARAFHWYLWSAERGDRFAQRRVANAYLNGEGTKRDASKAAYWFRRAVAPWQLTVMNYSLSRTYASGHLVPVDPGKSRYYLDLSLTELRALVREPNGEAAYYLGLDYEHGHGVRRDPATAMGYLCRAAALHYTPAIAAIRHLREGAQ